MSEAREFKIVLKRPSRVGMLLSHVVYWGTLVGAVGLSRTWYGGAVVTDVLILFASFAAVYGISRVFTGVEVVMTRDECRRWFAAGEPADAKEWLEKERSRETGR